MLIKPEDIKITKRPLANRTAEVSAELRLANRKLCQDDSADIEYSEERARREVWRAIYGDLAVDIERLRMAVLPHMLAYAQHSAMEEFDKIASKLRDPIRLPEHSPGG